MPIYGNATGLGKLNISSGLGEPLRAEIELLSVTPDELSTLVGGIASEEAYAVQGITRLGVHNNIKVDLVKNASGTHVLMLRTAQPIDDPYLDLLIQLDWESGRLLKEYTVLLDPPGYKQAVQEATATTITSPSSTSASVPVIADPSQSALATNQSGQKTTRPIKKASSDSPAKMESPEDTSSGDELVTRRGDTLNSIASEMQVDGVSLDQMLVGLFENNKSAFANNNMNQLKVGQIIKVPSKDMLVAIDAQQAKQSIRMHASNWNQYRNALSASVEKAAAASEAEHQQVSSGKIATAVDKANIPKAGPQDVVKLSAGTVDAVASSGNTGKEFSAKIATLQEEATAREKVLKEAQDRTSALEKQIEDMQKLLALKNQSMAELQKNAEHKAPVAEVKSAETKPAEVNPPVAKEAHKAAEAAVKPVEKVVKVEAVVEPVTEPSFIDSLLANEGNFAMLGGAATVTLLGGAWMYLRNRRRKDLDSFERGILTSGGLRANTVFGNTTGSSSTSDTSFLTDFAQSADGNMIDTHDVDPIAEAEVYMAYGREAQAEEILKDAISKEPKRHELQLKLLEMYANRKDTAAFETVAGELYTSLGSGDPVWVKVAELGATIEPGNPLYDVSNTPVVSTPEKLTASDFENVPVATSEALDFSLDDDLKIEPVPTTQAAFVDTQMNLSGVQANEALSFDLGELEDANSESTAESKQPAALVDLSDSENVQSNVLDLSAENTSADNSLDFNMADFDLPQSVDAKISDEVPASVEPEEIIVLSAPELDLTPIASAEEVVPDIEFNLSSVNLSFDEEVAPVLQAPEISLAGINLDLTQPEPDVIPTEEESVSAEEITFDFPLIGEQTSVAMQVEEVKAEALEENEFDFSAINLDLGDDDFDKSGQADFSQPDDLSIDLAATTESENQGVDIKLDLVAAYIDMDDKEGARELLDEVVKEGGPQQRLRAEQLLASLA